MRNKKLPQNNEVITRSFGIADFRADDEEKSVEGHAAVYDQKTNIGGYFYEVIERGAFDGCDFDDVLFFVNHDTRKIPLARSRRNNGNSTMQIKTDDKGLHIKSKLDTEENAEARSLYSSIKRGDIDGMSFMFHIKEARWTDLDTDMPTRHILKFRKVFEVSAVNMPAYSGTDINVRDQAALDNAAVALENARSKELDNSSNELELVKFKTQILMKG
ncbi:phage prohead protease, HK97 family [Alkaliphilus metalliredigens QYMF]|uniref:Phage prohead protease, HK97 family n=1 Tax=Alkaliphilus metalliredigens (strain QYMF) TaxID=293826 RepID=A6TQU9_ALKMQ|nr:HK97 family phage prohead protease [Alkaliphilus metalliredigens]ABR48567.1 phage prohead protease, HK97 family [Alkaliphilus metalliredigens QYMF]